MPTLVKRIATQIGNINVQNGITIGAVTTPPTKGVMARDFLYWYRDGSHAVITYQFFQSATTGAAAGNGQYLYSLPAGLVADTNVVPIFTGPALNQAKPSLLGQGEISSASGPTNGTVAAYLYSSTQFRLYTYTFYTGGDYQSSTFYFLNQAAVGIAFTIKVPILGWS